MVVGVNPKHFLTFREGGTAYTLQQGSNSFGQYLSVTELKVGGLRRTIIIPAGKFQQGWKTFGIELRRRLEPSQYALGGPKFVPYKSKQIPKFHAAKSFVEAVKAPLQARSKPAQQLFIKENAKDGVVEKKMELPRDSDTQAGSFLPAAKGDDEVGEGAINGKSIIEAEIPEGNNTSIPFKFNSNSKVVEFGKELDFRKSRWLGSGLIVEVNEFGKRRVSWDGFKRGKQAGRWVPIGSTKVQTSKFGLAPSNQKAQGSQLGNNNSVLGLGLLSPSSFEAGESSLSGQTVLEHSDLSCLPIPSSGKSVLKKSESLAISQESLLEPVMSSMVSLATSSSLAASEVAGEVHGALRCLALLSGDLDDKMVPALVPVLFPCLLTIVSSPQVSSN
nr:hypothetical protein CFP56_53391 [Quercus suber]